MSWKGRNLSLPQDRMVILVKAGEAQRLDRYLSHSLNWKSRARMQALIRSGRVKLNDRGVKPSSKVRGGDRVTLELSRGTGWPEDYSRFPLEILYEDPWLVAVNKPPGLLVHPVGRHVYDTLINHLHYHYRRSPEAGGSLAEETAESIPRLCHRIDRDTTGLVLVAKEPFIHREITYQFAHRLVAKEYIALVAGSFPEEDATLATPIGEGRCLRTCLEHEVLKDSRTTVRVLERFRGFTLLACAPQTGRQNQIRVHLAARGHPLLGDRRYGGGAPPPGFPERFLLHSRALVFYHPRLKSRVELAAPLPEDFRNLLQRLRLPDAT